MNNIGILADFSKTSGLGHFKRMIGLSKELKRLNSKCVDSLFIIYQYTGIYIYSYT